VLIFLTAVCIAQFAPERLLQTAETELSLRGRVAQSSATVAPTGAHLREDYQEIGMDLDARVGILSFLTAQLSVPPPTYIPISGSPPRVLAIR